ncbi:MAG TPA: PrsW family glutamic-type intramembrane protease [Terriglobia bacterium]|nr:PrsW family glutamic-type intramembrane protease [Terriglobia bacterium]
MGHPLAFDYVARLGISILPVFAFLFGLRFLDSYKLVSLRRILMAVFAGLAVAGICYFINSLGFEIMPLKGRWYPIVGAPILEESLKAAYIAYLMRKSRIGFMVDAAIYGFAVGAGFALLENIVYLNSFQDKSLLLWTIRGFGTAMMHGGTTAIFGIMATTLIARVSSHPWFLFLPGLVIAIGIHSFYNMALLPLLETTVAILIGLPVLMSLIFLQSEKSLQSWLGNKLDKDMELMQMIATGRLVETKAGLYLRSLTNSFPPQVVGDMLCLLQISLELSAIAKGDLMRREAGFPVTPDPSLPDKFKELAFLEKSIGMAGKLAVAPLVSRSSRDLWEVYMLSQGSKAYPT